MTWIKLGLVVGVVAGVWCTLRALGVDFSGITPQRIQAFVLSFGVWAPLVYVLAYGQPIIPLPASLMTALGGAVFGKTGGVLAAVCGASLRACTQFFVARWLGREAVAKLLRGGALTLDQKIGENGFKAVWLIRLIPNLPFDVQNYMLGFSRVRFGAYALATVLGIIPGSFAYVFLGYSLTDPRQIWKLFLAIALIIGLMVGQHAWKARHRPPSSTSYGSPSDG